MSLLKDLSCKIKRLILSDLCTLHRTILSTVFLRTSHGRIVAEEGEPTDEIVVEADIDDEEDMVSEELAEVYLAQGLKDMAIETYRKLSLLNPEKSVYFAGLIEKIDKNN